MPDVSQTFDRVVVVNLDRRPERMERFWQLLGDWPFRRPERFAAIDGAVAGVPAGWERGAGAWGCMLSHRQVIRTAIDDGLSSVLLLEDDAFPVDNFARQSAEFLQNLPDDWDCIMWGGEHILPPHSVAPGIVQCVSTNRTHAFAIRGRMMKTLLEFWEATRNDHCDLILASLMRHFKAYAPEPFLIGQDAGYSDITGFKECLRFLSPEHTRAIAAKDSRRYFLETLVITRPERARAAV
ncbi:MAG TPA: hypothetical protein VGG19_19855 [Tepidisphaeraceae bacterium]|jgi:hypothetical protein